MKIQNRNHGIGGAHVGMFGRTLMLREEEKEKPGGGDDAEAKLIKTINTVVHRIMSERDKRSEGAIAKAVEGAIAKALEAAGVKPKPSGEDGGDGGEGGGGDGGEGSAGRGEGGRFKGKPDPAMAAALAKATKAAEDAKKIAEGERELRLKAERKADSDEERAKLTSLLTGRVRPEQLDDVVEILGKRITRDPESRAMLWKGDKWSDKEGADNSTEVEELEGAIAKWSETPKGKSYAPPRNLGGGGNGPPGGGGWKPKKGDEPATDAEIGSFIGGNRR